MCVCVCVCARAHVHAFVFILSLSLFLPLSPFLSLLSLSSRGHTDAVLCLQFDNEKIVSGSKDTTIKVCFHLLLISWSSLCHTYSISSSSLQVWLLSDDQCHLTLHGHQGAVTCLQFDESRVISGALDRLIKIWSITSGEVYKY